MYKLQANIWVNEVALDGYNVRAILVCDDRQAVVWDTLSHPQDMDCFLPLIGDRELTIIYSHGDWDHIWGTAALPHHRARVIGHNHCLDRFDTDIPATLSKKQSEEPEKWNVVKLIAPTLTFQEKHVVDLTISSLSLHYLPGHTPDSIVAFLPDAGLLLMGDTVETPFPVLPEKAPLTRWLQELQAWGKDPRVITVVPSHGHIGGREILHHNINYLQNLLAGREYVLPANMTDFYTETHRENLRVCKRLSAGETQ